MRVVILEESSSCNTVLAKPTKRLRGHKFLAYLSEGAAACWLLRLPGQGECVSALKSYMMLHHGAAYIHSIALPY